MVVQRGCPDLHPCLQNPNLVQYSGYTEQEILPTAQLMADYIHTPSPQHEMFEKKWSSKKYMKAITYLRDWVNDRWGPGPHVAEPGSKTLDMEILTRGPLHMDVNKESRICRRGFCNHD
jgi:hypothetical protein